VEYLKTESIEIDGETFEIRELSFAQYQAVVSNDTEDGQAQLMTVSFGCTRFAERTLEDLGDLLPLRTVGALSSAIINLSTPGDEVLGKD
jgi:hypothetical protein